LAEIFTANGSPLVSLTKWKKSSIRKVFFIFLGHLWVVELAYRYIFSFKLTLSCQQQSDIVPIVGTGCKFATGVVDTGGNMPPTSLTLVENLLQVSFTQVANLPTVSTTPGELVAKFAAGVVDKGGKFAAGVVDISSNFAAGVVNTCGEFATMHLDLRISL
jgi:hypothetical protein